MQLEEVLKRTAEVAVNVVKPFSEQYDKEALWPEESLKALQKAGLAGLVVPKENGGLGQGLLGLVKVCEILGKSCSSTSMCFDMHHVGIDVIANKVT